MKLLGEKRRYENIRNTFVLEKKKRTQNPEGNEKEDKIRLTSLDRPERLAGTLLTTACIYIHDPTYESNLQASHIVS